MSKEFGGFKSREARNAWKRENYAKHRERFQKKARADFRNMTEEQRTIRNEQNRKWCVEWRKKNPEKARAAWNKYANNKRKSKGLPDLPLFLPGRVYYKLIGAARKRELWFAVEPRVLVRIARTTGKVVYRRKAWSSTYYLDAEATLEHLAKYWWVDFATVAALMPLIDLEKGNIYRHVTSGDLALALEDKILLSWDGYSVCQVVATVLYRRDDHASVGELAEELHLSVKELDELTRDSFLPSGKGRLCGPKLQMTPSERTVDHHLYLRESRGLALSR